MDLNAIFAQLGAKPKVKNKEELETWMEDYIRAKHSTFKQEPRSPGAAHTPAATLTTGSLSADRGNNPNQPIIHIGRKPWLAKFTGENAADYRLWRHQLTSLLTENHTERDIKDAIRASLHGKAGLVTVRMGPDVTISDIIAKMDSIYGQINSEADVLAAFYGARQEATETVAEWGCRVESLLDEVKQQRVQLQRPSDEMLRTVLWTGLRQDLKDVSSYHYDRARSFDELRVVLRRLEQQHPPPAKAAKPSNCKAATKGKPTQEKSEIDDLKAAIHQLTTEVRELKAGSQETDTTKRQDPGKNQNHQQDGNEDGRSQQQTQGFNNWNSRGKGNYRGAGGNRRGQRQTPGNPRGPRCYKCGEYGHIAIGCRVRVDHLRNVTPF
nr:hypothetical protein BaRGS_009775 [Batillaria attramentaria]